MPKRKDRLPVVVDINIYIVPYIKHKRTGAARRIFDLWLFERKLQLILSPPLESEYLGILRMLGANEKFLQMQKIRFHYASNVTFTNLRKRSYLSRDPKDNMLIDTAYTGKAKFLITKDADLLEIPKRALKGYRFSIIKPNEFLKEIGG